MQFKVVIPARYDSTRFPGKVLKKIGKLSMLECVYNNAVESNASEVFIATDSDIIFKEAETFTNKVIMTSCLNKNGTERVAELATILQWKDSDLVINLQADMPELKYDNINFLAEKSINNRGLSTLYYPLSNLLLNSDKNTVKIELDDNGINFYRILSDLTDSGNIYKHIGIYAYLVKDLLLYQDYPQSENEISLSLEQCRFLDNQLKIQAYEAVSDPGISVDSIDNLNEIKSVNN